MNKLEILYEDNHIIVVVKPSNVLSQGDITGDNDMLSMIKEYIKKKYDKKGNVYLGLVHRLDRPVSGVMVFAKSSKAASRLSDQIRTHVFKKRYLAVVNGIDIDDSGEFVDYLVKDDDYSSRVVDKKNGKYCKLMYTVLERNEKLNLALVDIALETGRHHQIRVQFAHHGHSLYGDQRYGKRDSNQIALHAYSISFLHPISKTEVCFSKMPEKIGIWCQFDYCKNSDN